VKLKTFLVTLTAAACLAAPVYANDGPGRPQGDDPGKQQADRSKDYGKKAAEARRLMERAKAKREQVLRHFKTEAARISSEVRAACGAAGEPRLTSPSEPAGAGPANAACEQAKQQAKAEFEALAKQTKEQLKRIEADLKAALQRLKGK
jgi:cell division septum initiation protein DivIVA